MPTEGITKQYHRVEQETLSQRGTSLSSSPSQWQASNTHSVVAWSPHFGHFQSGRGLAGSSADFTDCSDYFSGAALSAICDPKSAIL